MTINLNVKIDLSSTEDAELVSHALVWLIKDTLEDPELRHLEDPDCVLAIIEDVEVTVR